MSVSYYSLEEISKNDGKNGQLLWIIYKNNVYDCTKFIEEHPGGAEIIQDLGGKDATKAFNRVGHSEDAKNKMKKLKIGEVSVEQRNDSTKKKVENFTSLENSEPTRRSFLNIITCGLAK